MFCKEINIWIFYDVYLYLRTRWKGKDYEWPILKDDYIYSISQQRLSA